MKFLSLTAALLLTGCSGNAVKIYSEHGEVQYQEWLQANKTEQYAFQSHTSITEMGATLFLLTENETPHFHKAHDLVLTLIEGKAIMRFEDKSAHLNPGDTVIVGKNVVHWLELKGEAPALFNLVAAPKEWDNDTFHVDTEQSNTEHSNTEKAPIDTQKIM